MKSTAADLRAEVARRNIRIYIIAPFVGLHPARLGQVLRGTAPLTDELAARIHHALKQCDEKRSAQ